MTGGAPAALLLQGALIYPFNALSKDGAARTTDFTALELLLGNATWRDAIDRCCINHTHSRQSAAWSARLRSSPAA